MQLMRVAGATLNQTPLDWNGNRERIVAILDEARSKGVELLCLPELCVCGYSCEDAYLSIHTANRAEETLGDILPATVGLSVVLGIPHFFHGSMYNCAVMVQNGKILGVNAKRVLPREGVHYEQRWFRPWPFGKVSETTLCGERVPFGDIRYRLGDVGVAIEICEEAWTAVPASAHHADAVEVVLNPSASHFALGKAKRREQLVANSSRAFQVNYVYANLVGVDAGRIVYDGGVLIAEGGDVVSRGRRFGFKDGEITSYDVNLDLGRVGKLKNRAVCDEVSLARFRDDTVDTFSTEVAGSDPREIIKKGNRAKKNPTKMINRIYQSDSTAAGLWSFEAEFFAAVMLGLFDYLRKSKTNGYVVSLSGGVDSSSVSILVAHMLAEALKELGPKEIKKRLNLSYKVDEDPKKLINNLLTCVYQKTDNSSETTLNAARGVAEEIGASFHEMDIQPVVDSYITAGEGLLGKKLTWDADDLTLQNIQARARSPLAWLMANAKGSVLLCTSNRSEAAVGYATMDGDTAGGLAPIAGIDKCFLRDWLVWARDQKKYGLGPLKSLSAVNKLEPTAELQPPEKRQEDEKDLMPYKILERIERLFIRDRMGPPDIRRCLVEEFKEYDEKQLYSYLDRFLALWSQSQWKRERLAPSFLLDDESLDPKTWCRYPILSGGYVGE